MPSFKNSPLGQTVALAGVIQSAKLVQQIARNGKADERALNASLRSLHTQNIQTPIDAFGEVEDLLLGLRTLQKLYKGLYEPLDQELVSYALAILQLARQLIAKPAMLDAVAKRLDAVEQEYECASDEQIKQYADIYQDTLSTFPGRIQVRGEPAILRQERHANGVRAALLCGVRAAVLWRQLGGHRWHFLLLKKRYVRGVNSLLKPFRPH